MEQHTNHNLIGKINPYNLKLPTFLKSKYTYIIIIVIIVIIILVTTITLTSKNNQQLSTTPTQPNPYLQQEQTNISDLEVATPPNHTEEPKITTPTNYLPSYITIKPLPKEKQFLLPIPSPIRNQGADSHSCNPTSVCYLFDYHYKKKFNKNYFFSAQYLFWSTRLIENRFPNNEGTTDPFKAVQQYGLVLDKHFKYDSNAKECDCKKYQVTPKQEIIDIGKRNIPKFKTYIIDKHDINNIKRALYYNGPILITINQYTNYNLKNPYIKPPGPNDTFNLSHAITLWGWDDDKKYWILVNSFGNQWGDGGLFYLDYDYTEWFDPIVLILDTDCPDFNNSDRDYINNDDWVCAKYADDINIHCPYTNTIQKGVECYWNPDTGYDWTTPGGLLVGKVCPSDTIDSGTTCYYDRGIGKVPNVKCTDPSLPNKQGIGSASWCDNGPRWDFWNLKTGDALIYCNDDQLLDNGLCYNKPRSGFKCTATVCDFSKDVKWGNKEGLVRKCP